jgi:DNA modification methylase
MYPRIFDEKWDFRTSNVKEYTHCYHNYPAMMIPQIARELLTKFRPEGEINLVFDPYMGSGTTLVECSILGINAIGTDINPLALMISEAKISKFNIDEINNSFINILLFLKEYNADSIITYDYSHITNSDFWYSDEVLKKLAYITDYIEIIDEPIKLFFKTCLSEVIREASYTRNGEFKRYRMDQKKMLTFNIDPFKIFINKIERNIKGLKEYLELSNNSVNSILSFNTVNGFPANIIDGSIDMVVTSPPYGDSRTTVAYGQFSRWASEWFKFDNAKNIDSLLMGGKSKNKFSFDTLSIKNELLQIKLLDEKRHDEVCTFLDEYNLSIKNISQKIRIGGRVCFVVGNRNVKGVQIPLDYFTAEMFENNGFKHDITIVRSIPNKRMPSKTSPTNIKGINVTTMSQEFIVILTKIN